MQCLGNHATRFLAYVSELSLEEVCKTCQRLYERDGYVKWADVGTEYGITRQAVQARLKHAVNTGRLDPAQLERWQSMSSRAAASRKREEERELNRKLRLDIQLTVENLGWLRTECERRQSTSTDVINGLINKARLE
jgi:hypothetical protein